jgi:excinuclease UvrABC ATPase subunit
MRRICFLVLCICCIFYLGTAFGQETEQKVAPHKYVGVKTCGMCHKADNKGKQLGIWEASKHSKAFKTLESEESQKIAQEKGLKNGANESPECLKCHVTGYGMDAALFDPKFDMKDGVQCEACHGPGSDYRVMSVMKDKDKALAAGLVVPDEKTCMTCHNEESPTFDKDKGFDFKAMWAQIAHGIPK